MEVKEWTYEDFPDFTEEVEGATWIESSGNEIGVRYIRDIEYANMNGYPLKLQILRPYTRNRAEEILPCIVFVKGSAWLEQNVYEALPLFSKLAERKYVIAVVQYRHSGIATFPAQIMDAKNAIRFMRIHADEYNIDPERILIAGDSSGGHTAMYAGILHTDNEMRENIYPGISAEPIGIINFYGSTSVMADDSNPSQLIHCQPDSPEGLVMGHVDLRYNQNLKRKLSVEYNITDDTMIAPTIIIHGTKDRVVNTEGSIILYRTMKKYGKDVKLYLIKEADHGGAEFWSEEVLDIIDGFVKSL